MLVRGGSDRRIVGIPEIGVKAGSLPDLKRADLSRWLDDLSRWLDDFAFSFPAPFRATGPSARRCGARPLPASMRTWKRALARKLRDAVAPPYRWLAEKLCMGKPGSVRAYVHAAGPGVAGSD